MKTCEYAGPVFAEPRSHPWVDTAGSPECRYYDLTSAPEHIRSSLEDFRPWSHYGAIEEFYLLLTALNHPKSILETNDCVFTGPETNENPGFLKSLQCTGRVMVLFRKLKRNTVKGEIEWLTNQLHLHLASLDPDFPWGVVGTTIVPVRYLALAKSNGRRKAKRRGSAGTATRGRQFGSQLMISFWAWGNSEAETMLNLGRLMKNLSQALRHMSVLATASG
jgi:hypothetical protein